MPSSTWSKTINRDRHDISTHKGAVRGGACRALALGPGARGGPSRQMGQLCEKKRTEEDFRKNNRSKLSRYHIELGVQRVEQCLQEMEIYKPMDENAGKDDEIVYTYGSVLRKCGLTVKASRSSDCIQIYLFLGSSNRRRRNNTRIYSL